MIENIGMMIILVGAMIAILTTIHAFKYYMLDYNKKDNQASYGKNSTIVAMISFIFILIGIIMILII